MEIDAIEEREQTIIQHIRTSGLRKPRESSLIEEMIELRKDRRKAFSAILSKNETISNQFSELKSMFSNQKDVLQHEISIKTVELQQELSLKNSQLEEITRSQEEYSNRLKQRFHLALREEKKILASQYEEKLQLIESKLAEVTTAAQSKRNNENVNKEDLKMALVAQETEMEKQYQGRIRKCVIEFDSSREFHFLILFFES